MSKYLVFGCDRYYPSGGWSDFEGSFETLELAQEYIKKQNEVFSTSHDYWEIVDKEKEEIVDRSNLCT